MGLEGGRTEQKVKKTHGHGQQCDDCRGKRECKGINSNDKQYNKTIKIKITSEVI